MGNHKSNKGLDSQDGIDSLTENRQKFIRKTEQAMEDKNENLPKKTRTSWADACALFFRERYSCIHKPAGMLSQRAKASDDSLNDYLIDYCIQTGIISKEELAGFVRLLPTALTEIQVELFLREFPSKDFSVWPLC